jgi:hypothetical protein
LRRLDLLLDRGEIRCEYGGCQLSNVLGVANRGFDAQAKSTANSAVVGRCVDPLKVGLV